MGDEKVIQVQKLLGELDLDASNISMLSTIRFFFWTYISKPKSCIRRELKFKTVMSCLLPIAKGKKFSTKKSGIFIPDFNDRLAPYLIHRKAEIITGDELRRDPYQSKLSVVPIFYYWKSYIISQRVAEALKEVGITFPFLHRVVFFSYVCRHLKQINKIDNLFQKNDFKAVFVHSDNHPPMSLYVEVAKKFRIPTYLLQHGGDFEFRILDYLYADRAFVWGRDRRDRYISNGVDPKRVSMIGHPTFSGVVKGRSQSGRFHNRILFCSRPHGDEKNYFFSRDRMEGRLIYDALLEFCDDYGAELLVKLHPCEKLSDYKIRSRHGVKVSFINEELHEICPSIDLVVSEDSSISLEACWLTMPLIIAHFSAIPPIFPFSKAKSVSLCRNRDELKKVMFLTFSELRKGTRKLNYREVLVYVFGERYRRELVDDIISSVGDSSEVYSGDGSAKVESHE